MNVITRPETPEELHETIVEINANRILSIARDEHLTGVPSSYRIFIFYFVKEAKFIYDDEFIKSDIVQLLISKKLLKYSGNFYHQGVFSIRYRFAGYPVPEKYCRQVSPKLRSEILDRDNYKCINCFSTSKLVIDHITPWSLGGFTEFCNLQTLCRSCNSKKSNNTNLHY